MSKVKGMFSECEDALEEAGVKSPTERQALVARLDLPVAKALIYHYQRAQKQYKPKTDAQIVTDLANQKAQLAEQADKKKGRR